VLSHELRQRQRRWRSTRRRRRTRRLLATPRDERHGGDQHDEDCRDLPHSATIRATPSKLRVPAPILLLAGALALTSPAPATAARSCPAPRPAQCLHVVVPLDRSGKVPGTIRIRAARIRSRHAFRPPIIGLTGGPGQAGVVFASDYDYILPRAGRDLIVLDQRGTGASGLLRCPSLEGSFDGDVASAVAACGRSLGARRSFYTSADSADDIEALRVRLGVPRIALFAVSYGTRVAVEYARRYPQRVERMILDSAVSIDAPDSLARETLGAVGRVLRTICRTGCGGAQAHPVADLARLVPRLRQRPIRGVVRRGSRRLPISVGADDLLDLLFASDLNTPLMRRIPPAVRAALAGNGGRLVGLKLSTARGDSAGDESVSDFSSAVYAATTCEESTLVWDPTATPATRRREARAAADATPASYFAPFDRLAGLNFGLLGVCGEWPARERVVPPAPPLPITVPTLVLSGDLDLRTPLEGARYLAALLHGKVVVEQGVGHGVLGRDPNGCAPPAVEAFLAGRPLTRCHRRASVTIERAARRATAVPHLPF
jgi:pimeloyl-ACP methyl ester carboxylesterase